MLSPDRPAAAMRTGAGSADIETNSAQDRLAPKTTAQRERFRKVAKGDRYAADAKHKRAVRPAEHEDDDREGKQATNARPNRSGRHA